MFLNSLRCFGSPNSGRMSFEIGMPISVMSERNRRRSSPFELS